MLPLPPPHTYARLLGAAGVDPAPLRLPVSALRIRLGFPSPAEDFQDDELDLNQVLIRNPPATFLYRAEGWSMLLAGVCDGDILVVDRSVRPIHGDMVLAIWDGNQPVCKILQVASDHIELHSRSPHCAPIILAPGTEVEVFAVVGVVRQVTRTHARAGR
ncbi:translesion error-prone DNA polymerase V autoproteolytic subunit [Xanthomonas axonopodis pv. begoniae]|nr:translesion error-prone DNA polymerase V autoproteolytic subunit [Xanthomonas axonopodis pv. begoniae]PPT31006.1 peptidase S24 [Xanthomonas axonopodis pv. begoniae]